MITRIQRIRLVVGLLTLILMGCVEPIGHERNATPTPPAPHQTPTSTPEVPPTVVPVAAIPPEIEQFAVEWPMAHKNYQNTRTTTDSQINAGNVEQLGVAWTFKLNGASKWGTAASSPLIANHIVYFQDLQSNVFALDLQSGERIWEKLYSQDVLGPNGPALGWGKLFIQDGINHLIALDLASGSELWSTELFGPTGANQPLAYGGYVYTGVTNGAYYQSPGKIMNLNKAGTSGYAFGVDQETGTMIWSFQTVEPGFWGNPELNSGAGIWFSPAIDTESGMTFWSTGNPAPMPGMIGYPNGSSRPGPNLYSETMLAISGQTGELVWYDQVREHDLFNYDFQNSPMLATAQIEGQEREVVIGTGKMGYVYSFDKTTGERYWETPVGVHENDELQELPLNEEVVMVTPGFWGGIESPAATADGVVYAAVVNLPTPYTATAFNSSDGDKAVTNLEGRVEYDLGTSEVVALDINNGEILWSIPLPSIDFGAVTVVNDLLFTATYDGVIYALSRADGSIVWSYQAPGGIIAWPAVVEDTIVWPVGLGREPVVLALRLGAEGQPVLPAARPLPTPTPAPKESDAEK
ncbi:MAG: PQQ-binding-like beta-propeller repeat protein [Caldilineaceae bacterium]|nr:PQQ-binding-like beta-propeller repeat protein [Caldilineaceae bacterium]